jgi:hypothetical protein
MQKLCSRFDYPRKRIRGNEMKKKVLNGTRKKKRVLGEFLAFIMGNEKKC